MNERTGPRLLFVNQHYPPDVAPTGHLLADLAEHLTRSRYDISVWCGRAHYAGGSVRAPAFEVRNGVRIRRFSTSPFDRRRHTHRVLSYALFSAQVFFRLLLGSRYTGVVFLTTPPLLSIVGYAANRLRRQPYAVWSMDLHPEAEFAAGMVDEHGWVGRILGTLATLASRHADYTVFLGSYMQERAHRTVGETGCEVVIPGWGRREEGASAGTNPLRREYNPDGRVVVMYAGNAGLAHRFEELLEAMERLSSDRRFRFLFVGGGARKQEITKDALRRGLGSFDYLPYFPRQELSHSLSLADIHLVSLRREFAGVAVPGKLYGIMSVARPVLFLGPTECETADVILTSGVGAVVDPYSSRDPVGEITRQLCFWAEDGAERRRAGERGRRALLRHYERDNACRRFEQLIRTHWGQDRPCG